MGIDIERCLQGISVTAAMRFAVAQIGRAHV